MTHIVLFSYHFIFSLGADITDYFNYGFTEDTWQAYCSRQRRMRVNESGAGLPAGPGGSSHHYNRTTQLNSSGISNGKLSASTNSSAPSSIPTLGSSAPPIRLTGTGVPGLTINTSESIDHETEKKQEPAPISVMTSDKRIYSKKVLEGIDPANPSAPTTDFSLPPPGKTILCLMIRKVLCSFYLPSSIFIKMLLPFLLRYSTTRNSSAYECATSRTTFNECSSSRNGCSSTQCSAFGRF